MSDYWEGRKEVYKRLLDKKPAKKLCDSVDEQIKMGRLLPCGCTSQNISKKCEVCNATTKKVL